MHFKLLRTLPAASLVASAACVNIHVSSYAGPITSFSLDKAGAGNYSLKQLGAINGSAPQPSWLEYRADKKVVYSLNEYWAGTNGSIDVFKVAKNGALEFVSNYTTPGGPVSTISYNEGKGLAIANYGSQSISSFAVKSNGSLEMLGNFFFTQSGPGKDPVRQDKPHPHQVILDPTGKFIVAPDLGSDLLRIFSIDPKTSKLTEQEPFATVPGIGPRHGAFYTPHTLPSITVTAKNETTYFYLVSELGNSVSSYKVTYEPTIDFELIESVGILGNITAPAGTSAAEAVLSPDNKFFHTSTRNATFLSVPNPDSTNATALPSDTLQTWSIAPATGKLTFVKSSPAGGSTPRQFSLNKAGTLAGVGLQSSDRFVIIERDVKTGIFGKIIASKEGLGAVTSVIFEE